MQSEDLMNKQFVSLKDPPTPAFWNVSSYTVQYNMLFPIRNGVDSVPTSYCLYESS